MFDYLSVVDWCKRTFTKRDVLLLLALTIAYFATRLINLDQFPIFSDEGIYIRWAKVAWHDASWRFISLTDGKQPLQTWGTIPFLKLFPNNALLAGRLFAVSTGFVALIGVISLLQYLFGKRTALIGGLLYVLTPYFIFYDRMALVDSGVNAFFIWMLFFSILLSRTRQLDVALMFGAIGGMALLAKSSVRIFLGLASFAPILFLESNTRKFLHKFLNFASLFIVSTVIAILIYNIQRLSPFFHYIAEKNTTFVMTPSEFLRNPFAVFFNNLVNVPFYLFSELSYVVGILGIIGFFILLKKDFRLGLYLALWFIIPFFIVAFLSKVLFPRYIIFLASLLMIMGAYTISSLKKFTTVLLALFILSIAYFDYTLLADYKNIPFPPVDRGQYIEGWPAGWGVKDIVQYAREKSAEKPVILIAEGNFGLAGDVLDTHLRPGDKIQIEGFWPLNLENLISFQPKLNDYNIYVVLSHKMDVPEGWPVELIKRFDKPNNQSAIYLLKLIQ